MSERVHEPLREQVVILAVALGVFTAALFTTIPKSLVQLQDAGWYAWWILRLAVPTWLAINVLLYFHRRATVDQPARLGRLTFAIGIACAAMLFTGPLAGWLVVLVAPAGILCGLVALALEHRAHHGYNARTVLGFELSVAAILVMVVIHYS